MPDKWQAWLAKAKQASHNAFPKWELVASLGLPHGGWQAKPGLPLLVIRPVSPWLINALAPLTWYHDVLGNPMGFNTENQVSWH